MLKNDLMNFSTLEKVLENFRTQVTNSCARCNAEYAKWYKLCKIESDVSYTKLCEINEKKANSFVGLLNTFTVARINVLSCIKDLKKSGNGSFDLWEKYKETLLAVNYSMLNIMLSGLEDTQKSAFTEETNHVIIMEISKCNQQLEIK